MIGNIYGIVTSTSFHSLFPYCFYIKIKYLLVLNYFVPLLCLLLSSVDVVQAECGSWSVLYLFRLSSTVIGQLAQKLR